MEQQLGDSAANPMPSSSTTFHHTVTRMRRSSPLIHKLKTSRGLWPLIFMMSLIVWILSIVGTFHCSFIMVQSINTSSSSSGISSSSLVSNETMTRVVDHPVGLGLFSTSVYDTDAHLLGCVSYEGRNRNEDFDGTFRAARAFGMFTTMSTTIALICVTLVTLFVEERSTKINLWSVARFLFFVAFLCQLLTFLAFARELCNRINLQCATGAASNWSIFNLVLLCFQSALIYVVPPVTQPLFFRRRSRDRPMSIIEMAHDEVDDDNNIDHEDNEDNEDDDDQQQHSCRFDIILPTQPTTTTTTTKTTTKTMQRWLQPFAHANDHDENHPDDEHSWKDGLKSKERGTSQQQQQPQPPSVIMEGIECVAAGHLRPETNGLGDRIQRCYFALGEHAGIRTYMGVGLGISWIFALVETTRCTFLMVGAAGQDRDAFRGIGLFNRAYYTNDNMLGCIAYPSSAKGEFDGAFAVGRAFGIMTVLLLTASFGSFGILHAFMKDTRNKQLLWWCLTQLTLPCALLAQLITFATLETQACSRSDQVECVVGVAGIFGILNTILLVPLSIIIFALACPTKPYFGIRKTHHHHHPGRAPSPSSRRQRHGPTAPQKLKLHVQRITQQMQEQRLQRQALAQAQREANNSPLDHRHDHNHNHEQPRVLEPSNTLPRTVKSHMKRLQEYVKQQQREKQELAQAQQREKELATTSIKQMIREPSTTLSVSAPSEGGFDDQRGLEREHGVRDEEGVEVCDDHRVVEEKGVTIARRNQNSRGLLERSTPTTNNADEYDDYDNPSSMMSEQMPEATSTSGWPTTLSSSGSQSSTVGPTAATTRAEIALSYFWDSQASLEQFETVEMEDTSSADRSKRPSRVGILQNTVDDHDTVRTTAQNLHDATCCLVQQRAVAILKEMQGGGGDHDDDVRREVIEAQPALVRSCALERAQSQSPMTNASSLISVMGSSLVSSPEPVLPSATCASLTVGDFVTKPTPSSSKRARKTARGGRAHSVRTSITGSSDAVGIVDPDDDTLGDDFRSKVSSTEYGQSSEDDGHTFNTGEYAISNENVTVYHPQRETRLEP